MDVGRIGAASRRIARLGRVTAVCAALLTSAVAGADELRGTVRDALGAPVANADFDVFDLDGNKLPASDNTDASGQYQLVLAPGAYDVLVQPALGSALAPKLVPHVDVAGVTTLDWVVPPAFRQLGRVRTAAGQPVVGVRVEFDRLADGTRAPALGNQSSPFGTFAAWVEHGTFAVTATPPESTGLAPARVNTWTMPGPDTLDFTLVPASRFGGVVRDPSGQPVAGARLAFDRTVDGVRAPSAENRTGADGSFRARVAPDVYRVLVEPPRGLRLTALRLPSVDLSGDATMDVTLVAGLEVAGRVVDREGRPLAGADWDVADEATGTNVPTPGDNTDPDGRYALVLPSGRYRLTLSPPAGSGLDTLVFRDVPVARDTTVDWSYASGGPTPAPAALSLVPLGNPTVQTARIRMSLPESADVLAELFDASGRRVRVLARGVFAAGTHTLAWDGRRENGAAAHTGVYFVRVQAGARAGVTRFVLLPRSPF